jgi:hypothetical protein
MYKNQLNEKRCLNLVYPYQGLKSEGCLKGQRILLTKDVERDSKTLSD